MVPEVPTGVDREALLELLDKITRVPDGFHAHPKAVKILEQRRARARAKHSLLGDGRGSRLCHASPGGHPDTPEWARFAARHVQPPSLRFVRHGDGGAVHPARTPLRRHRLAQRPRSSRSGTARSPRRACSASTTATASIARMPSSSGRRSSVTSRTPVRSSSISSSPRPRTSGCACRASSSSSRTATRAPAPSTRAPASSAGSRWLPRTTSRSATRRRRRSSSTFYGARCSARGASRWRS